MPVREQKDHEASRNPTASGKRETGQVPENHLRARRCRVPHAMRTPVSGEANTASRRLCGLAAGLRPVRNDRNDSHDGRATVGNRHGARRVILVCRRNGPTSSLSSMKVAARQQERSMFYSFQMPRHPLARLAAAVIGAIVLVAVLALGMFAFAALVVGGAIVLLVKALTRPSPNVAARPTARPATAGGVIEGEFKVVDDTRSRVR
jgi:hypothetical protein